MFWSRRDWIVLMPMYISREKICLSSPLNFVETSMLMEALPLTLQEFSALVRVAVCRFEWVTVFFLSSRVSFRRCHRLWWLCRALLCFGNDVQTWDPGIEVFIYTVVMVFCQPLYIDLNGQREGALTITIRQRVILRQRHYDLRQIDLCICPRHIVPSKEKSQHMLIPSQKSRQWFLSRRLLRLVRTNNWFSLGRRSKSYFFKMTMVQNVWYHNVDNSDVLLKILGSIMRCAKQRLGQEMLPMLNPHQSKINSEEGSNRFNYLLASETCLPQASSNSLFLLYLSYYMAHISAYVIIYFQQLLYTDFVNSI